MACLIAARCFVDRCMEEFIVVGYVMEAAGSHIVL